MVAPKSWLPSHRSWSRAASGSDRDRVQRRCFLHIGTHKTGTTSIQAFLAANRSLLAGEGLYLPLAGGNGDLRFACHHGIVRELLGRPRDAVDRDCFATVMHELSTTPASLSCLSSEDFSLLYDRPDLLRRLRDGIRTAGFTPHVVVYLRPQASYATAIYAANVDSGYRTPFAAYLKDVITRGCYVWDGGLGPPFDYIRLLAAFAAVFGEDAITVRRFQSDAPDGALITSFVRVILPRRRNCDGLLRPEQRANRTLTFAGVLRRLDIALTVSDSVRFAPLSVEELLRLQKRFHASNRAVARSYGTRIPVVEGRDIMRAQPLRRTPERTRQLARARKALRSLPHL